MVGYNDIPPVPGADQNPPPGGNVADWLNRLGPGDLNQVGDLAILNASIGSSSYNTPSMNSQAPSTNPGSGQGNCGPGQGGALGGQLALVPAGPRRNDNLSLGLSGELILHGIVPRNLHLGGADIPAGTPARAAIVLEPYNPLDDWVPPAPRSPPRLDMNLSGGSGLSNVNAPSMNSSLPSASGSGLSGIHEPSLHSSGAGMRLPPTNSHFNELASTQPLGLAATEAPVFDSSGSEMSGMMNDPILAGAPRPPSYQPSCGSPNQYTPPGSYGEQSFVTCNSSGSQQQANITPPPLGPASMGQGSVVSYYSSPARSQPSCGSASAYTPPPRAPTPPPSIPSPSSNYTPQGCPSRTPPPPSPASVPGPGDNYTPPGTPLQFQNQEDIFRTPPRPDRLCGEDFNFSGGSGGGGLGGMTPPSNMNNSPVPCVVPGQSSHNVRQPMELGNDPGGLGAIDQPDFNSTFSSGQSRDGLGQVDQPSFNSTYSSHNSTHNSRPASETASRTPSRGFQPQQSPSQVFQPQQSPSQVFQPQQSPSQVFPPQQSPSQVFQPQQSRSQVFQPQQSPSQVFQPQSSPSQVFQPQQSRSQVFQPQQSPSQVFQAQSSPSQRIQPLQSPSQRIQPLQSSPSQGIQPLQLSPSQGIQPLQLSPSQRIQPQQSPSQGALSQQGAPSQSPSRQIQQQQQQSSRSIQQSPLAPSGTPPPSRPCTPASVPSARSCYTPQGSPPPPSPASVPSARSCYTPQGSPPPPHSPASVPSGRSCYTPPPLPHPLDNYVPPIPGTPCGDNLNLNVSGGGISGLTVPSLNSSEQSYLQNNFNNFNISGLRSGLSEVSEPSSLGSSIVSQPVRVSGNLTLGSGASPNMNYQMSPPRPAADYYRHYNFVPNENQGIFAQIEPNYESGLDASFSSSASNNPANITPPPPSPASIPSGRGNAYTPPPRQPPTPASVPCGRDNAYTPPPRQPPTPASVPSGRDNAYTPPPPTPASVPSGQDNRYTPPPRSGGPQGQQEGNYFVFPSPQSRPEDNFRTPPRPDVLLGENLNLSNVSNRSGGLDNMGTPPNLNDTISSIGTPSLESPGNRSGLDGVFMPSFNSTFSDSGEDQGPVTSTPLPRGPGNNPNPSPPDMIQFSPPPSPNLIQFSPDGSPIPNQNGMQFNSNSSDAELDRMAAFAFGSPGSPGGPYNELGIRRLEGGPYNELGIRRLESAPPRALNQSQRSVNSEIDRLAELAFGSPQSQSQPSPEFGRSPQSLPSPASVPSPQPVYAAASRTQQQQRSPQTPESIHSPETSAMNRMVQEAQSYMMNISGFSSGGTPEREAPRNQIPSPDTPQRLRPIDIVGTPIRLPATPYADSADRERQNDIAWNSFDEDILRQNQASPGAASSYSFGSPNQSGQSNNLNNSGYNSSLAGQLPFANCSLNSSGAGDQSLNSTVMSSVSQQPVPPSPFFYQSSTCGGNFSFNSDRSGGGAGAAAMVLAGSDDPNMSKASRDSGYSTVVSGYAPNPLVNSGNSPGRGPPPVLPGAASSPSNRVFDSSKLKSWVMDVMGNSCQGHCGKAPNECQEHTLKYLMGLVTSWRNLYSRRSDGRFNYLASSHVFDGK